jgi:hypothetical protein
MSNNSTDHGTTVVVEQSTTTTIAPIHEVTEAPTTLQSTPLGKIEIQRYHQFSI